MINPYKDFPFQLSYLKEPGTYNIKHSELKPSEYGVIIKDIVYNIDVKFTTICYYNNDKSLYKTTNVTLSSRLSFPNISIDYGYMNRMLLIGKSVDYGYPTSIETFIYFNGYKPLKWIFNILPE